MAVLQQGNTQLAQKQVNKVNPVAIQNSNPLDMSGQNNEAMFKAVTNAIDIGAEVYQKMDDASVDLELKDEQARMAEHFNNQAVLRENGIGTVNPNELKPKEFKETYEKEGGTVPFGEGKLTPYKASEDLSDRALNLLSSSIQVANSNFTRDTQIAFAKELKTRGLKNLDIFEKKQTIDYEKQLSSITHNAIYNPLPQNRKVRENFFERNTRETADFWSKRFEEELQKNVATGNIIQSDADARLLKHKQDLAFQTFKQHMNFDPDRALEKLRLGEGYEVEGVGVDPIIQGDYLRREAEREFYRDEKKNWGSFTTTVNAGMKSPFLIDKVKFLNDNYNVVENKLEPKEDAIRTLALDHRVRYDEAKLYLEEQAVGQKPIIAGQGIESGEFNKLINAIEADYKEITNKGGLRGESTLQRAEKTELMKLLSTDQREKLTLYKAGWDKTVLFSNSYREETLTGLQKKVDDLKKEFTKDDGFFKEPMEVFNLFVNNFINPRIEKMLETPKDFLFEDQNIDLGTTPQDEKIMEMLDKKAKFYGLPPFDGDYRSDAQQKIEWDFQNKSDESE